MKNQFFYRLLILISILISNEAYSESILAKSPVEIDGIGPIKIGMNLAEASRASNVSIKSQGKQESECEFAAPVGGPEGLGFWLVEGRIAMISIRGDSYSTSAGVRIGDLNKKVLEAYKGKIQASPKPKSPDESQTFKIMSKNNAGNRLEMVFYSFADKVGMITAGRSFIDQPGQPCKYQQSNNVIGIQLDGSWKGMTSERYPVELFINQGTVNIGYPTLNCGGVLELIKSDPTGNFYREHITAGKNMCFDGGQVRLVKDTQQKGDLLEWHYEGMGHKIDAQLHRVADTDANGVDANNEATKVDLQTNQSKAATTPPAPVPAPIPIPEQSAIAAPKQAAPNLPAAASTATQRSVPIPNIDCSKVSGFMAQAQCIANMASKLGIVK